MTEIRRMEQGQHRLIEVEWNLEGGNMLDKEIILNENKSNIGNDVLITNM